MEKGQDNMADENNTTVPKSDMDGGWKDIIEDFTEDFFKFYFPDIHDGIDFSKGVKFRNTQLNKILSDSDNIKRDADKLMEVTLLNGDKQLLFIHVEVQSYFDSTFAERMYVYNYRIYDTFRTDVMSLALLIDDDKSFRPTNFTIKHFGFRMEFEFPMVKILDYDMDELEGDDNPFAIATRVQLAKMKAKDDEERYSFKLNFAKGLYKAGYTKEKILNLYKFIDFVLTLPEYLAIKFKKELEQFEEANGMPYVTSNERLAKQEGLMEGVHQGQLEKAREDVLEVLDSKSWDIPYTLKEKINYCDDLAELKAIFRKALRANSINELSI